MKKKGDSMMVSYVLLIVIAVAISAAVYTYLKLYVPTEGYECNEDISLTITSVTCNTNSSLLYVELTNTGLFNIDGAFLRFAPSDRSVRPQLPENKGDETFDSPLRPGKSAGSKSYNITGVYNSSISDYTLEVQPASFKDRRLVPCSNKIITQPVVC